jgi:NDP-sugar pyrophosphorylase family protein
MILCAGLGTRLSALSDERPKPLLPVCDQPLVRYSLTLLRAAGVRDVIVNTHHHSDQIVAELGEEVAYSHEQPTILGTGGAVKQAARFLGGEPFLLVNGKIVLELDVAALLAQHERSGALATLVVRKDADAARWGAVDVDEARARVCAIRGAGEYMFTGVHVIAPELIDLLPPGVSDIVGDGYLPALARGRTLGAFILPGYFWEHSTPERYLAGNWNLLHGRARLAAAPGPLSGISPEAEVDRAAEVTPPVLCAPGALVAGGAAIGPDVVVGRGARVPAGARLSRVVLWPGAVAPGGPLSDAIVTPRGVFTSAPAGPTPP